ncbi:MAG: agmatinase [Burkholderiales bacterium]
MNNTALTFISCDNKYKESTIVIFGAPFDGTTSFHPGTRFAPQAMRSASDGGIETYSIHQNRDLSDIKACDIGNLTMPIGNSQQAMKLIEKTASKIAQDGKIPVMLGGEHLVTLGAVRPLAAKYPDLHIIHFDAHSDLRDKYFGQKLSHATVMRRIWDIVGDGRIFQYGIRSGEREEVEWGKFHVYTNFFNCNNLDYAVKAIKDKPCYLSIDLDVLDSSVLPGTGTPEAGGISFNELIESIFALSGLNIVGADITELSPHYDASGGSTLVACKVLRELLLMLG